jgi:hypothetical protein
VTVCVEGYGYGGVPKQLLDELRVNAPLEQERRASVTQVVEGDLRQIRTLQERREGPLAEVGWVDEATTLTCENEALIVVETTDP